MTSSRRAIFLFPRQFPAESVRGHGHVELDFPEFDDGVAHARRVRDARERDHHAFNVAVVTVLLRDRLADGAARLDGVLPEQKEGLRREVDGYGVALLRREGDDVGVLAADLRELPDLRRLEERLPVERRVEVGGDAGVFERLAGLRAEGEERAFLAAARAVEELVD